jgi:hypothetical protein
MDQLLYLLGPVSCAVMMAAMLWMMRGRHSGHRGAPPGSTSQQQIAALRAEIAALRQARTRPAEPGEPTAVR